MRILSFNFLKNCKLKTYCYLIPRQLSSEVIPAAEPAIGKVLGDPNLLEFSSSWPAHEESELRAAVSRDMRVLPNFVSEAEEAALLTELEPYLKRMRYEFDHWDNAIQGYRETERRQWSPANEVVIQRVKEIAFPESEPLPHTHVLDLAPGGHIKPHVDAVRFCGPVIAGLCLMSTAVMRLQHCSMEHLAVDALLQRRALYIMRYKARLRVTKMQKYYFVCFISPVQPITVLEIPRDEDFIEKMVQKSSFYKKCVLPKILLRRVKNKC